MTGYWPSSLFCIFMDRGEVEVHKDTQELLDFLDFMALEVLENRISGNHNFLLTVRLRLLVLSCRLG